MIPANLTAQSRPGSALPQGMPASYRGIALAMPPDTDALKGRGFSRAVSDRPTSGALAPEGSLHLALAQTALAPRRPARRKL